MPHGGDHDGETFNPSIYHGVRVEKCSQGRSIGEAGYPPMKSMVFLEVDGVMTQMLVDKGTETTLLNAEKRAI